MTPHATGTLPTIRPDPSLQGPLSGIRVVDLSRLVAGNMLSLQMADFGADVIKVEAAGTGDTLRAWRETHPDHKDGFDGWWRVYGRNKRSLALDLRDAEAMGWLRRLVGTAQVLVESFRPGTLEAMGLAPEALHAATPGLVIVRLSGWGQTGPYRDLPGFGSLIEGFCGFADKHRHADGTPGLPNMALADMVTGLTGAFAVMAALREVEVRGGRGPGDRPLAARAHARHHGAGRDQRRGHWRAGGDAEDRLAARRLSLRRWRLGVAVGLDRQHGAARLRGDRPARADRGSALLHQRRADRE